MGIAGDIRAAARVLARAPFVPALVAGLTAVGFGLMLGMWAILDAALLRPLPLPDPEQLVAVFETHAERGRMSVAAGNYLDWSPRVASLQAVGGTQAIDVTLGGGASAQRLAGARVTPGYFDVWRVPALRGRPLAPADFVDDPRAVVLSARVWRQALGGTESVVGSTVRIDGRPCIVVGVMPPEASVVGRLDIWTPWVFEPRLRTERRFHDVGTFARLAPGAAPASATAELANLYAQLAADHPDTTRGWSAQAVPLRAALVETPRGATRLLAAAVVATLAVAVLNIVALLAGWWPRRRAELLTRRALGASTLALVRQLAIEGALMMSAGAAAGLVVARAFIDTFGEAVAPSTPWFAIEPALDLRVAGAGALLLGGLVAVALLVPAWRMARGTGDLAPRRAPAGLAASHVAIAVQVGTAFVLLVTATALLESAARLAALAPEASPSRFVMEVSLADARYPLESDQRAFFTRLLEAVRKQPDVADAGAASYVPPSDALGNVRFEIEGRNEPSDGHTASPSAIDARALSLMGVRLLRGRLLDERDRPGSPPSLVISDALARRYWPGSDPLGRRIRLVGVDEWHTIVGVVSDVRRPLSSNPRAETVLYLSYQQMAWPFMTLIVEPRGDMATAAAGVRRALAAVDPDQAPGPVRPFAALQSEWLVQPRLQSGLVTLFGSAAVLLTLAGLYARVAYAVTARARECAVRQAVGAAPGQVTWLLTSRVVAGAAAGLALGALALPAVSSTVSHVVFEVALVAWPRVAGVGGLLALAVWAACYLPARAMRLLNLAQTLRSE